MRNNQTTLYSFAAPLALMPAMFFQFTEVGDYFRGDDFRTILSELITQIFSGLANNILNAIIQFFLTG